MPNNLHFLYLYFLTWVLGFKLVMDDVRVIWPSIIEFGGRAVFAILTSVTSSLFSCNIFKMHFSVVRFDLITFLYGKLCCGSSLSSQKIVCRVTRISQLIF